MCVLGCVCIRPWVGVCTTETGQIYTHTDIDRQTDRHIHTHRQTDTVTTDSRARIPLTSANSQAMRSRNTDR